MRDEGEFSGSDATGRHRSLKPSVLGVRFPPPASMFEMGMNAKRTSDRFFKPDLESSSLSIPAWWWLNPNGAGAVCGTAVREFDSLQSPF